LRRARRIGRWPGSPSNVWNQRVGTPRYWIVDVEARVIERWRPDDARPEVVDGVLEWQPAGATAPLALDVATLLAE
jgi:hypothetical protein